MTTPASLARAAALVASFAAATACAVPRQMAASPDDLADYRVYRKARREGGRLAAAQRYLRRHPQGTWAAEVQAAFDTEEDAWFEAAKTSRSRARDYVVDLPDGPHADAARSLLVLFDEHQSDFDTLLLIAAARRTSAALDVEAARRRHVSDVLLGQVAALADRATWGASIERPPPALAAALRGAVPSTWDGVARERRQDTLIFVIPTPQGAEGHALTSSLELVLDKGRVVQGSLLGEDLFVIWSESILVRVLDPNSAADRALAASTIADVLGGALEAALPAARCAAAPEEGEVFARSCDGWNVSVRMGHEQGETDVVDVVGPRARAAARAP